MQLSSYPQQSSGLYVLRRTDMDDIATYLLNEHMPQALNHPMPVDVMHIAEEDYGLLYKKCFITLDSSILGMIFFSKSKVEICDVMLNKTEIVEDEGTILIDRSLLGRYDAPRRLFTMAHEFSHWILHRSFHSPTNQQFEFRVSGQCIACRSAGIGNTSFAKTDGDWMEWQADALAAALLMPKEPFTYTCYTAFRREGYNRIPYRPVSRQEFYDILSYLSETFGVSKQAAGIRMKNLGIFNQDMKIAM